MLIRNQTGIVYLTCSKCTALVKFALRANIVSSLVAFLASQWYQTFQSFGNLHFLGLTFFHSKDVFLNGLNSAIISFQYLGQRHLTQQRSPCGFNSRDNKTKINHWIFFKVSLVEYFLEYFKIFHGVNNFQRSKSLAGKNFRSLLKICENCEKVFSPWNFCRLQ